MDQGQDFGPIVDVGNGVISVVLSDLQPIPSSDSSFYCD
jgi:hypothetical protein